MTLEIIALCFAFFGLGIQVGAMIVHRRIARAERLAREERQRR